MFSFFGGCCFHPLLVLSVAVLSILWVVVLSPLSSVGSRCLVFLHWAMLLCFSSPFGGVVFLLLLRSSSLLLGGAAWFPFFFFGLCCCFPSSFAWCCFPFSRLGSVAFLISSVGWCGLVSFGRCCFSNLFSSGAAFSSLGGAAFFLSSWVVLPFVLSFWWDYF